MRIAQGYLIPRQRRENSLRPDEIEFTEDALRLIIRDYTREAGVRNLEREIGRVCRKVATRVAEGKGEDTIVVEPDDLYDFLGRASAIIPRQPSALRCPAWRQDWVGRPLAATLCSLKPPACPADAVSPSPASWVR